MLRHIVMKAVFVLLSLANSEVAPTGETAIYSEPAYAKWGKLAVEETSKAYRDASIIDYKYEGRRALSDDKAEESFLLWLRKNDREFGVRVRMTIQISSDELLQLKMAEVPSN